MNSFSSASKASTSEQKPFPAPIVAEKAFALNAQTPIRSAGCACGGDCPKCKNKNHTRNVVAQAKLQVGAVDDVYEHEADRVADEILATLSGKAISGKAPGKRPFWIWQPP
jgi:hypothetical protein